jgi:hypothetical protein
VLLQLFFTKISISIITLLLQHLTISIQLGKDSKGFELYTTNQCLEVEIGSKKYDSNIQFP